MAASTSTPSAPVSSPPWAFAFSPAAISTSDSRPAGEIGPRCAIVNQAFVKRYLAGRDPLGVLIARGGSSDVKPTSVIVGVVADMSYRGLRDPSEQVFFPLFEHDDTGATFYIKVRGGGAPITDAKSSVGPGVRWHGSGSPSAGVNPTSRRYR